MFRDYGIFSKEYTEHQERRDKIRRLVLDAREKLEGTTLYGKPVDLSNPEDVVACLYLMYRDAGVFHERLS